MATSDQQLIASRRISVKRGKVFGMRMAEAFFRRWPLYLLPIIALTALGVQKATKIEKEYRSVSTLNVSSSSFLSDLTSVRTPDVGYETPATKTARNINEQMTTASFATSVAAGAGLTTMLQTGTITLDYVRSSVTASASGDTLMLISATTFDPELSQRLATSLESKYTAYVLGVELAESKAASAFYTERITDDNVAVNTANTAVQQFLTTNPSPSVGTRSEQLELQLKDLTDTLTSTKSQLSDDKSKLDQASLAQQSAATDISQRLQVLDPAEKPLGPEPIRTKQAFDLAIFGLLGLIIAVVALVLAAMLDKIVRSSEDIAEASGLEVVATIPVRRKSKSKSAPRRVKAPDVARGAA